MKQSRFPIHPILIVDDEPGVIQALSAQLKTNGIDNLVGCPDSREVMGHLHNTNVETVLLDLTMPHVSGQQLLDQIHEEYPYIPVIVVTAANEVQTAVECMRAGAFDYMVKAIEENRLVSGVRRAIEIRELKREYGELRSRLMSGELRCPEAFSRIITRNSRMKSIFLYAEAVAKTGEPVLITGETGVGKDLIARAIHDVSSRAGKFVSINTGGQDEQTFSDALFGHTKGAFTGADKDRDGFIHTARQGTLFLDEIGDLSGSSQIKLLQLLDSGVYYPLGSDLPRTTDARILLATNRNLNELMEKNLFRKDLYYRISTHEISIPPLRERREDVLLLLTFFVKQATKDTGHSELSVPAEIVAHLSSYPFPGNIRELEKLVKNAVAVANSSSAVLPLQPFLHATRKGTLRDTAGQVPEALLQFGPILPTFEQARKLLTSEAMRRSGRSISKAAHLLGISHQALSKWLKKHLINYL